MKSICSLDNIVLALARLRRVMIRGQGFESCRRHMAIDGDAYPTGDNSLDRLHQLS